MLYSYRHPDLAASIAASELRPKLSQQVFESLVERRRFVRPIPVATVVHCNDADAWNLWDASVGGEAVKSHDDTAA
jgi:hypothetical protein